MIATLATPTHRLSIDEIRRLTDRQVDALYGGERDEQGNLKPPPATSLDMRDVHRDLCYDLGLIDPVTVDNFYKTATETDK